MDKREYEQRQGFSLIELLIAITILVIFVGGAALSLTLLRQADTKGLASSINDSLTDLKSMSESMVPKEDDRDLCFYLHIYKTENGYYSHFDHEASFTRPESPLDGDERLGSSALNLQVSYDKAGTDLKQIDDTNTQTIRIQKKDGAYTNMTDDPAVTIDPVPKYFEILNGDRADYRVYLAKDTGMHYMDRL